MSVAVDVANTLLTITIDTSFASIAHDTVSPKRVIAATVLALPLTTTKPPAL